MYNAKMHEPANSNSVKHYYHSIHAMIICIASYKICRLAIAQCVSTGLQIATKYYNDSSTYVYRYSYVYIRMYIAIYVYCSHVMSYLYRSVYRIRARKIYVAT